MYLEIPSYCEFNHLLYDFGYKGEIDKLIIDNDGLKIDIYEFKSRKTVHTIMKGTGQLERSSRMFKAIAPEYKIETHLIFMDAVT